MYQYIETKCFVVLYLYKMSACVIVDMATEGKKSYMCASYETPCFNLEKNASLSLSHWKPLQNSLFSGENLEVKYKPKKQLNHTHKTFTVKSSLNNLNVNSKLNKNANPLSDHVNRPTTQAQKFFLQIKLN